MKTKITLLTLFFAFIMNAQTPTIEWNKTYGGSNFESAKSIVQTSDGGYVFAGQSDSVDGDLPSTNTGFRIWVVKTNAVGVILWQKLVIINGIGLNSSSAQITKLNQTSSGEFIISGWILTTNAASNSLIIKLDVNGDTQWFRHYGGSDNEIAFDVRQTNDGGFIVCSETKSNDGDVSGNHSGNKDVWLTKTDEFGNIQWQKAYGGFFNDEQPSISLLDDGSFLVACSTYNHTDGDVGIGPINPNGITQRNIWVFKTDSLGNLLWGKVYGGTLDDGLSSILKTNDGGFILTAATRSNDVDVTGMHVNGNNYDIWVSKMDSNGIIQWQKAWGGQGNEAGYSNIVQTSDSGYCVFGISNSNSLLSDVTENFGSSDYWIIRLSANGNLVWQKSIGGSSGESSNELKQTNDGGFILIGGTASTNIYGSINHGGQDIWLVKLLDPTLAINDFNSKSTTTFSPNPTTSNITFSQEIKNLEIFDITGKKIKYFENMNTVFDVANLEKGIYLLKGKTVGGNSINEKLIKN